MEEKLQLRSMLWGVDPMRQISRNHLVTVLDSFSLTLIHDLPRRHLMGFLRFTF